LSSRAAETFGAGGESFADTDSLARRLEAQIAAGVTVLIKGSRINRLERVVQHITSGAG
jgi:UDP-N-acetylmuramoyl-tripeptide--D-alanyl-D-alanine ligase